MAEDFEGLVDDVVEGLLELPRETTTGWGVAARRSPAALSASSAPERSAGRPRSDVAPAITGPRAAQFTTSPGGRSGAHSRAVPRSAPPSPPRAATAPTAGTSRGVSPKLPAKDRTVAGPDRPAAGPRAHALPAPSGPGAATRRSYPDAPRHRPRWASGVHLDAPNAESVRRAARLARARGGAFDVVAARLPARTWADIARPTSALATLRQVPGRKVLSVSLLPDAGGSLRSCAKGRYHAYWQGFAASVAAQGLATAIIDLRPDAAGAADADPAGHAACYRRVVASVRTRLPHGRTQWSVPRGARPGLDPARAWPGADVVSVIGIDAIDSGDDWGHAINGQYGLNWWADFARRQGRQVALAQWGVFPGSSASAANAPYMQNMHDWLVRIQARKQLAYEAVTAPEPYAGAAATVYRSLFWR